MEYTVVITHNGDQASLDCDSYEEALRVKQSFINYGKYQSVVIDVSSSLNDPQGVAND